MSRGYNLWIYEIDSCKHILLFRKHSAKLAFRGIACRLNRTIPDLDDSDNQRY